MVGGKEKIHKVAMTVSIRRQAAPAHCTARAQEQKHEVRSPLANFWSCATPPHPQASQGEESPWKPLSEGKGKNVPKSPNPRPKKNRKARGMPHKRDLECIQVCR